MAVHTAPTSKEESAQMFECSHIWQATTQGGTKLDHFCRCLRQYKHDGEHRCSCEPINFFHMTYSSEDS